MRLSSFFSSAILGLFCLLLTPPTLVLGAENSCLTATVKARKTVWANKYTQISVKLSNDGPSSVSGGDVVVTFPDSIDYKSSSVFPKAKGWQSSPKIVGDALTFSSISLAPKKSLNIKLKVQISNCAADTISVGVKTTVGKCVKTARSNTINVKRSKKSGTCAPSKAPTPAPTVFYYCREETGVSSPTGAPVYACPDNSDYCGAPRLDPRPITSLQACIDICAANDYIYAAWAATGDQDCYCYATPAKLKATTVTGYRAYVIGAPAFETRGC